jgi:hypothetical protein
VKFTTKQELAAGLRDAANLEHQLMLQYLYAGFSLKRDPDATCTPAQYEAVRRWSSTLFMIARQEMEHLSFANGMLTAIGEPPHFARLNIGKQGLQSPYFTSATLAEGTDEGDPTPVSLPYTFARFDLDTLGRFICGESPPYHDLPAGVHPTWCFHCDAAPLAAAGVQAAPEETRLVPVAPAGDEEAAALGEEAFIAGSVQELYTAIKDAFASLDDLFVAKPSEVDVPVEYNVFVFPVTDRTSAIAAVNLILEQGEGLGDPWNLDSHFRRFYEIRTEFCAMRSRDANFDPAYLLLENPESEDIANDFTRAVFDVCNDAYVTLLFVLAGLYQYAVPLQDDKYPYLSTALSQNAFAPAMTMIVRALNEVLVLLPVDVDGLWRTGSNYYLDSADLALLLPRRDPKDKKFVLDPRFGDIVFLLDRWEKMTAAIDAVATRAESEAPEPIRKRIADDLRYVHHSAHRTGSNLRQTYQSGLYTKFISV